MKIQQHQQQCKTTYGLYVYMYLRGQTGQFSSKRIITCTAEQKLFNKRSFEPAIAITSAADINIQTIVKHYLLAS